MCRRGEERKHEEEKVMDKKLKVRRWSPVRSNEKRTQWREDGVARKYKIWRRG